MTILPIIRRWTWEFPQSLLGLCLIPFYRKNIVKRIKQNDLIIYICNNFPGGVSLGYFIYLDNNNSNEFIRIENILLEEFIKHEIGHSIQSKYLGPFYIGLIGIPSIIHNLVCRIKNKLGKSYNYYNFYTEKWANKLGKVKIFYYK